MNEKELSILQELEKLCREYQSLQNRFDMDSKRRTIRNLISTRVFRDYCPLYWRKEDVQNAGLEITNTIASILKTFNPGKSEFSHYLNSALKKAILKGRQNAIVGDSEQLKAIQKETAADSDTILSNKAAPTIIAKPDKISGCVLDAINCKWTQENERHKPFLSLYLNSIFYEFDDYGMLCHKYECLSATSKEFSPSMQQQEMAAKYGIEKTNASKIISRFWAKMPCIKSMLKCELKV
ncbi:MAG: hypothetical protein MJY47_05920 [Fibrobacter sp.]|nr:hypothetical protein [Fibrobacter sp.]